MNALKSAPSCDPRVSCNNGLSNDITGDDEALVVPGVRAVIEVFWPLHNQCNTGAVFSIQEVGRHNIACTDGDIEILNLHKKQWHYYNLNGSSANIKLKSTQQSVLQ